MVQFICMSLAWQDAHPNVGISFLAGKRTWCSNMWFRSANDFDFTDDVGGFGIRILGWMLEGLRSLTRLGKLDDMIDRRSLI